MKTFFTRSHSAQYLFHLALVVTFLVLGTSLSWAQFIVTNTNDSGAGSLRQAIFNANGNAAANTIIFDSTIFPSIIFLQSELPALTGSGDSIDGHVNGVRAVTLHGGCSGPDSEGTFFCPLPTGNGIQVHAGNITISGLIIQSFPNNGISIRPGVNVTGVSILDNQILINQRDGITVSGGPGGNQVEVDIIGNEVFSNGDDNITVLGSDSSGAGGNSVDVVISGNVIKGALGNENATFTGDGIRVTAGVGNNVGNNHVTALISNNIFGGSADSAVSIIGGAAPVGGAAFGSSSNNVIDVTISGNVAHNSGLDGNGTSFTLSAGTGFPTTSTGNELNFAVVGNTSNGVIGPGIFVSTGNGSGQVVSGTIANNTIKNSTNTTGVASGDGIIVITSGSPASLPPPLPPSTIENVIIEGNTITNNEGRGILITDSGGTNTVLRNIFIDGNNIDRSGMGGIRAVRGSALNVVSLGGITNNQVSRSGLDGIFVGANVNAALTNVTEISGNRSDRNGQDGIDINGTGYVVSGNRTDFNSAGDGLNVVSGNNVVGNTGRGNRSCNTPGCF